MEVLWFELMTVTIDGRLSVSGRAEYIRNSVLVSYIMLAKYCKTGLVGEGRDRGK